MKGRKYKTGSDVYRPAEDTFLLADCLQKYRGRSALEIGAGSGFLTAILSKCFQAVVGTDLNLNAVKDCLKNYGRSIDLVCCDGASALSNSASFDLIIANPPYLPDDSVVDGAIDGGKEGVERTIQFLRSAFPLLSDSGKILVVVSSLSDAALFDQFVEGIGLQKTLEKEKGLFFERLSVFRLSSKGRQSHEQLEN